MFCNVFSTILEKCSAADLFGPFWKNVPLQICLECSGQKCKKLKAFCSYLFSHPTGSLARSTLDPSRIPCSITPSSKTFAKSSSGIALLWFVSPLPSSLSFLMYLNTNSAVFASLRKLKSHLPLVVFVELVESN